jgi:hypothetical protein
MKEGPCFFKAVVSLAIGAILIRRGKVRVPRRVLHLSSLPEAALVAHIENKYPIPDENEADHEESRGEFIYLQNRG